VKRFVYTIHDPGTEFTGEGFQRVLRRHGIVDRVTMTKNPQSNAICECMHHSVAQSLQVLSHANPVHDIHEARLLVDTALQTATYAVRAAIHGALKISPGALIFHRDMLLDIPIITDLHSLQASTSAD
jgi:hypothetical protein